VGRRLVALVVASLVLGSTGALADDPQGAFEAAVRKTAAAKTVKIASTQRVTRDGRTSTLAATGILAAGDSDVSADAEGGKGRRVSVGTTVKARTPDLAGSPWRTTTRPQPAKATALGDLRLPDGTSIGDARLYRSLVDRGLVTLPSGDARQIVGELDMDAVAQAMGLGTDERARLSRMSGTLTLWITADGSVARNTLVLTIPGATAPTTIESTIDLSDLDAAVAITLP
jgi:hypothetical protein